VRSVSASTIGTFTGDDWGSSVSFEGRDLPLGMNDRARRNEIGPGFFATLGVPLLSGRDLRWSDDSGAPKVAVVNATFARRFFPQGSPIGARIGFRGKESPQDIEIVGLVRDSKGSSADEPSVAFVYTPYLQSASLSDLYVYVRAEGRAAAMAGGVRDAVRRLDPALPIRELKTLRGQLQESLLTERLAARLAAAFGGLALLLAAVGIYGVLAYALAQRRREIGVRIALGATAADVRRLLLADVGRFLLFGGLVGLPAAWALGRVVESSLFGVRAADASTLAAACALMAAIALAAGYLPSRRATRVDPAEALRAE
jgi:predicted permease